MILDYFYGILFFVMGDYANSKNFLIQQISKSIDLNNDSLNDIDYSVDYNEFNFNDIGISAFILIIMNHLSFSEKNDINILKKIKEQFDIRLDSNFQKIDIDNYFLKNLKDMIKFLESLYQQKGNLSDINLTKLSNSVKSFYNDNLKVKRERWDI